MAEIDGEIIGFLREAELRTQVDRPGRIKAGRLPVI
jgi:hypothetical protein